MSNEKTHPYALRQAIRVALVVARPHGIRSRGFRWVHLESGTIAARNPTRRYRRQVVQLAM